MALKDLKPKLYASPSDIRNFNQVLTSDVITDDQIEFFIDKATRVVQMHLYSIYSAGEMITDSYCGPPVPKEGNTGTVRLYGASAGASAYTEQWTIVCATSTFSMTGNLQGQVASANVYTSHLQATDISISASAWGGTPTTGDTYYVNTYDAYPVLVTITSMLAAAYTLNSKYTEEIPNLEANASSLETKALGWLEKLSNPNTSRGLAFDSGATFTGDIDPVAHPYQIDEEGADATEYYPDRGLQNGETKLEKD